jgi:hypothetical protein
LKIHKISLKDEELRQELKGDEEHRLAGKIKQLFLTMQAGTYVFWGGGLKKGQKIGKAGAVALVLTLQLKDLLCVFILK